MISMRPRDLFKRNEAKNRTLSLLLGMRLR